ncbi:AraC family transcriptional regulator [Enterobacter asburiae]|uniref:AraC family transcriptional regulator n=1 Tax=Enterobacter asburiae TaxID=61645 RepID=A0A376FK20_ENTAS|nr:AraC family transcriptional regulator [Enterobacter asburiae]
MKCQPLSIKRQFTTMPSDGPEGQLAIRRGEVDPPHQHPQGQLLFAIKGVMLVETGNKRWVIPPQRALWIPPFQEHTYSVLSTTELRAVWFSPALISQCEPFKRKEEVHVITATALFKELIAGLFSAQYRPASQRSMAVLLLEILSEAQQISAELPMPVDERLHRVACDIIASNLWTFRWKGWRNRSRCLNAHSHARLSKIPALASGLATAEQGFVPRWTCSQTDTRLSRWLGCWGFLARRHLRRRFAPLSGQRQLTFSLNRSASQRYRERLL